jgi:hypothetical protein
MLPPPVERPAVIGATSNDRSVLPCSKTFQERPLGAELQVSTERLDERGECE